MITSVHATEADAALGESIERGYTLPAEWYTSQAIFDLEHDRIFRHSWQYAGMTEQISAPGDFFTYFAGRVPILVLRDKTNDLRAFVNVCRHRGSQLVLEPCGTKQSIQCHYHAWTYNLDGSLRAAPGSKGEPGFCPEEFPLLPVQIDTWGPFIFINPDRDAAPLSEVLGDLPAMVAATGIDLDALRCRHRDEYDIAANWKVVNDNYLECYHCPVAHPGFSDLIDLNNYTVAEYEYFSVQTGAVRESAKAGKEGLYQIQAGVEDGFYAFLWPNFTLNIYPGPGNVSLNLILPIAPGRTRAVYEYCFVDQVGDTETKDFIRFIDQVQKEDIVLCESVQRGLSSGYFGQGKLLLSRESALRHFQRLVYRNLTADRGGPDSTSHGHV